MLTKNFSALRAHAMIAAARHYDAGHRGLG